ncbi:MAG: SGNH/GDSL hydrolase family protein [Lentisphaeria bacterium]|nr:SGNH/GDSL hydrolase family protein [Lentisphaeria bacterium]
MAKTILFQGDSITDTGRSRDPEIAPNTGLGIGYALMTAAGLLAAEPEKDWKIYNRGISGNRVVDLYARWKIDALNIKPDILSILIGVNDTWHEKAQANGVEVPRYDKFYRMLLDWTREELPETKLVLIEPFVLVTGAVTEDWVDEINARREVVKAIAKDYNTIFIPAQSIFDEAAKHAPADYWLVDGVHPSAAGHKLLADAWIKATESIR